ncbi:MAG: hypothetical protein ABSD73_11690 [Candidatus Bathyarchaeia archaeon]
MNFARGIAILLAILAMSVVIAFSLQSAMVRIQSTGTITAVGVNVFSDAACSQNVTSISWGVLSPGSITNNQTYIKSTSNVPITLSLGTDSWNPTGAATYITLTWSYAAGTVIQPNASLPVTLILTVSSSVVGFTSFSFNIDITGSG